MKMVLGVGQERRERKDSSTLVATLVDLKDTEPRRSLFYTVSPFAYS